MKQLLFSIITAAVLLPLPVAQAAKAGKPPSDAPATTTIRDIDENTGLVNSIGSDSLGSYVNGANSVSSIIQGIGDWVLDTKPSTLRRVRIDFGDPVPNTGANAPFQSANVPVRLISKCASWNIFLPGLAVGQQVNCPLALSIDYNGVTYALRANENFGGTDTAQWTCLARNSTKCISFEMVPSVVQADGQRKIAMQLLIPASKRTPEQLLGRFYESFHITVTTP
jgi:hypothetical protein